MQKNTIVKSNTINQITFYKTPVELKIFSKLIVEIRKQPNLKIYSINTKELMSDINFEKDNYVKIKKIARRMFGVLERIEKDGVGLSVIFTDIDIKNKGYINFTINENIRSHLLNLTSNYTSYKLKNIASLNSKYSIRIYELLKQFQSSAWYQIDIPTLRDKLNIDEKKYKLYSDFKRKVILQAQKELKKHTDIKFEFREIKTGKKVEQLYFEIMSTTVEDTKIKNVVKTIKAVESSPKNKVDNKLLTLLKDKLKLDDNFINEIFSKYDEKKILNNANYTLGELSKGKVKSSIGGYLRGALKSDYANQTTLKDINNGLEEDKKKRIEQLEQKKREEEQKERKMEQLEKEFVRFEKSLVIDFVENNLSKSVDKYNELKALHSDNVFAKYKDFKENEILNFVKNGRGMEAGTYRTSILKECVKNTKDLIAFSKDKGFEVKQLSANKFSLIGRVKK